MLFYFIWTYCKTPYKTEQQIYFCAHIKCPTSPSFFGNRINLPERTSNYTRCMYEVWTVGARALKIKMRYFTDYQVTSSESYWMLMVISLFHTSVNIRALISKRSVFLSSRAGIFTKVWKGDILRRELYFYNDWKRFQSWTV